MESKMQTIKIEIDDNLYYSIVDSGINIQEKLKDVMYDLIDDGYPAISTQEAKKRVFDSVQRYKSGSGKYTPLNDDFWNKLESKIDNL